VEFVFLAACHMAELTDRSLLDEVLHLIAVMQYYRFQSVVGMMWVMADKDGRWTRPCQELLQVSVLASGEPGGMLS